MSDLEKYIAKRKATTPQLEGGLKIMFEDMHFSAELAPLKTQCEC